MIGLLGSMLGGRGGRMIGGMIGGRTGAMVGGLAGAMLGGRQIRNLGRMVSDRGGRDERDDGNPPPPGAPMTDSDAEVLVRAMCNAAKADGHVDQTEADQILAELGDDVSANEKAFLQGQLALPVEQANSLAAAVPDHLKAEAYAVSLIAINVDTVEEADYLRDFSAALGLSDSDRNDIHDDLGADLL